MLGGVIDPPNKIFPSRLVGEKSTRECGGGSSQPTCHSFHLLRSSPSPHQLVQVSPRNPSHLHPIHFPLFAAPGPTQSARTQVVDRSTWLAARTPGSKAQVAADLDQLDASFLPPDLT